MIDSEYAKHEVREVAYKKIAEKLGEHWTLSKTKSKINNLRAQLGREIKKTKKTKSGQSRDKVYRSIWAHWDRMQFLVPQLKPGSTADTIGLQDIDFDKNIKSREINDDNKEAVAPKAKRKCFVKKMAERKIQLPEGVANMLATPKTPQGETPSSFAMYFDDKLQQMDARFCRITEKRIMEILCEVEMGTTCATHTQRQHSISMRPAEALYSNATTTVQGQYSSDIRPAEA